MGHGEFRRNRPSEIKIGDSLIMISDGAGLRDLLSSFLYVYVENVDVTYQRAVEAGAETLEPPSDLHYGDRRATVKDAWAIFGRSLLPRMRRKEMHGQLPSGKFLGFGLGKLSDTISSLFKGYRCLITAPGDLGQGEHHAGRRFLGYSTSVHFVGQSRGSHSLWKRLVSLTACPYTHDGNKTDYCGCRGYLNLDSLRKSLTRRTRGSDNAKAYSSFALGQ